MRRGERQLETASQDWLEPHWVDWESDCASSHHPRPGETRVKRDFDRAEQYPQQEDDKSTICRLTPDLRMSVRLILGPGPVNSGAKVAGSQGCGPHNLDTGRI
jgi:hypothetical protein